VNLPDKEMHTAAHAETTHAVDILAFVEAQEIPPDYYETHYTLAPIPGGEKVYALLRETLRHSGKIGIACVVIQSRQHLAAVIPQGQTLVLNTLRWTSEDGFSIDEDHAHGDESTPDLATARQLAMTAPSRTGRVGFGRHEPAFQAVTTGLGEHKMKAKKIEQIVVDEPDGLMEDDDLIDDDCLALILGRRAHPPDGHAMRRERMGGRRRHAALWPKRR